MEIAQLIGAAALCVWALVMQIGAWRTHTRARQLLADARAAIEKAKAVHVEVERLNDESARLHADAVRLLAEADQLAADARSEFPPPDDEE